MRNVDTEGTDARYRKFYYSYCRSVCGLYLPLLKQATNRFDRGRVKIDGHVRVSCISLFEHNQPELGTSNERHMFAV